MWALPGPGIEQVSPELTGGFLTTGPPGKSLGFLFLVFLNQFHMEYTINIQALNVYIHMHISVKL